MSAKGKLPNSDIAHSEYCDFAKQAFIRNLRMFSQDNLPHTIEEFSDDFFGLWAKKSICFDVFGRKVQLGGSISFCYVDGHHGYDFCKRDFENTDRFLEIGGFVLFDDTGDGSPFECAKLMAEIKERNDYRVINNNPNYLFQKIA